MGILTGYRGWQPAENSFQKEILRGVWLSITLLFTYEVWMATKADKKNAIRQGIIDSAGIYSQSLAGKTFL